ncbi:MAG: nitroreductase family protein [Planctomycetia bacterium]|nr:nitroreductase family protein [Planctomycetia bacterium]
MLRDWVIRNRSYRRFDAGQPVSEATLRELVDLSRLTGSAGNLQRLKYAIVSGKEKCDAMFPLLRWAAYLTDWAGPEENERPTGYVVILRDHLLGPTVSVIDEGIAAQTLLLGAVEKGLGGCMIASCERMEVLHLLGLDSGRYEVSLVVALGVPTERVVLEPMTGGDCKYWRDPDGTHHVPKRSLDEVLL